MKALKIVWHITLSLAEIVIVLAMFHVAKTDFETIAVAGLVIIYSLLSNFLLGFARVVAAMEVANLSRFATIAELLDTERAGQYTEELREQEETIQNGSASFMISLTAKGLIGCYGIWQIIATVL
jgi:hypothetical protein